MECCKRLFKENLIKYFALLKVDSTMKIEFLISLIDIDKLFEWIQIKNSNV